MMTTEHPLYRMAARRGGTRTTPYMPGVVVVGAGKGGVGTSTTAALLALEAAESGLRTLLVDLDDGSAVLPALLGLPEAPWIDVPGEAPGDAADRVVPVTRGLAFLSLGLPAGVESPSPALRRIRLQRAGRLYKQFELVVVDGGSRLASVTAALEPGAGRLVAVTTPDRISLAATHALFKATAMMAPGLPLELVVNRADAQTAGSVTGIVREAAGTFLRRQVELAAVLPEDGAVLAGDLALPFLPVGSPARAAAGSAVGRWG